MSQEIEQSGNQSLCNSAQFSSEPLQDIALFICHELRTPLTSIQGALGLLYTGHLGKLSEEGQRVLAIAISNANRLSRLANAIENRPTLPMMVFSDARIEQLQLENDLHEACDRQEFQLVYQPIITVESKQIIGFEALARWYHPHKGSISPTVFIPLAEKLGCIHHLGMSVLKQACQQLYLWQQQFPVHSGLTMSVNLSALQLLEPNLIEEVQQVLCETQISPQSLKLEITESALIENQEIAIVVLSKLRALGIQLYVDDFGTGYSSLGRLQDLPIDVLKIDRSFIQGKQWDISETIILLASKLGLDVIAEGVETVEDVAALQSSGCQKMQGYFFSKPIDGPTATNLIASTIARGDLAIDEVKC
ncbi:EAL domain-containing protein [Pantanalinema sp. GBBB05]|uniref:putative bifunctional diguanylate cyclase/phosphodiesterase n=1 Tax=Pantanalinema sp. GBBB05 TaxID=2604139 RepID=UPI001D653922|nr:EAL domain-containing protein [Pantanalinema sp. GBBB05]